MDYIENRGMGCTIRHKSGESGSVVMAREPVCEQALHPSPMPSLSRLRAEVPQNEAWPSEQTGASSGGLGLLLSLEP